jgi:hypothetical protein
MGRIGLDTFNQLVHGADDDAKVRLGATDHQPKTAKHGLFGRAVRWLFGATKQDRKNNQKIMGDLSRACRPSMARRLG